MFSLGVKQAVKIDFFISDFTIEVLQLLVIVIGVILKDREGMTEEIEQDRDKQIHGGNSNHVGVIQPQHMIGAGM